MTSLAHNNELRVSIERNVPDQVIEDALTMAAEGGSNYWIAKARPGKGSWVKYEGDRWLTGCIKWLDTVRKCGVKYFDKESGDVWVLDSEKIERGIQAMAKAYPERLQRMLDENGDVNEADVFLQCCLFGEVTFG